MITKNYASVELDISTNNSLENKQIFDELEKMKNEIETSFGSELSWERLDTKKMSRIAYYREGVNVFVREDWTEMLDFLIPNMIKLENTFREPLKLVKQKLNFSNEG